MKVLHYFIAPFMLVAYAEAQELKQEIAKCAAIENGIERLAAYDKLAAEIGAYKPQKAWENTSGKWELDTKISPIDDTKSYYAALRSENTVGSGHMKENPTLLFRYSEGDFECYIHYGIFLGTKKIAVTTRIDKNEPRINNWSVSSNHKAIFCPNTMDLVGKLLNANALIVRLTPYGDSPETISFDLTGIKEALTPMMEAMR